MQRLQRVKENLKVEKCFYDTAYTTENVNADLEAGRVAGPYGGCHASYWALAEVKHNIDLHKHIRTNTENPLHNPDIDFVLKHPRVRARWNEIVSLNPYGMYSTKPTISGTKGTMRIDELRDVKVDGKVVNEDGSINIVKAAIDAVWNLPGMAKRLNLSEDAIRASLIKYFKYPALQDKSIKVFLPQIGGTTVYFFGDLKKLVDESTEVAVRVHDECNGSDVFGTDICTCRPYLMFSIQGAVECAQRGGVGVVVYYRKEGRALGEVTKFRVYNARKNQQGGDRPEMYFYQTEAIAGIRDARFQEIMPDPLLLFGITRIDWLMSMSSDKYDAIVNAGIHVMQRISLPDEYVPEGASVEIVAKIASGYHTEKIDAAEINESLWALELIRVRCQRLFELAKQDKLTHMKLDLSKLPVAVKKVIATIREYYPDLNLPYHSRWRHFTVQGEDYLAKITKNFKCDALETARRLVDIAFVSVLLDAGAGQQWKYGSDDRTHTFTRSEGIAIATLDSLQDGLFSTDAAMPYRVNSLALKKLELSALSKHFQVNERNPFVGMEGRVKLLNCLGAALESHPEYFGYEVPRPGNLVDYLLGLAKNGKVGVKAIWDAITLGLQEMWPVRAGGVRHGDVWSHNLLKQMGKPGSDMIPFHKLLQWLTYSLIEPLQKVGIEVTDLDQLTALAEYRNGGLLMDTGVITPKKQEAFSIHFDVGSEFVVEWRALTIVLIDMVADEVRKEFKKTPEEWPLAKILEGTWRAGRECAKVRSDAGPPIHFRSDGTVF
jgi:GTP cyclohydrolase II